MTTERRDGPTPAGGDYSIATWVDLRTLAQVDRDAATGIVITEYATNGKILLETVAEVERQPAAVRT